MRHLDLFSGIGGFALAASWVWSEEHEIVAFCEIDKFCQKVLKKHWPDVPIIEDVRDVDGKAFDSIDLLTGGFPCQPFSCAGQQKGSSDSRFLWPQMLRIISEAKPRWVIGENVSGIHSSESGLVIRKMLAELENVGFEVFPPLRIPACAQGAPHRRDRYWFVAHFNGEREPILSGMQYPYRGNMGDNQQVGASSNWLGVRINWTRAFWRESNLLPPRLCRVDDGIPEGMDRVRALGNAVVPAVAQQIMQAIKEVEFQRTA
jgi:DNA (cytosine-5)-methyltransferase 1